MQKKYIVRLSDEERGVLVEVIGKLKGSSQKVRRAPMLMKADTDGPAWTDSIIAEAFSCRRHAKVNANRRGECFTNLGRQHKIGLAQIGGRDALARSNRNGRDVGAAIEAIE